MTDAELVEASRRGEREAFGRLVARYQDVVCAVSYSSTGNWALSEDVAQDTFLAAWRQLGELRDVVRLRSWLCSIARNLARKARRRTDREQVATEEPIADANPFDATAQAEVDRIVREALSRVPETYRETLVLYYCENRSAREVAAALGISEDAAMQRLARGRRYLASGVTELVERALRPRRSKSLVAGVLAALPLAIPSRVDASPKPGGSTMLKLAIAAALATTAGTAGYLVHRSNATSEAAPTPVTAAAQPHAAVAQPPPPTLHAPTTPHHAVMPTPAPTMPTTAPPVEEADMIPKAKLAQLGIEQGPSRGPANAPVTIVVYQDLICPFCANALGTIDQLFDEYPGKLRLVVKQFPVHDNARLAAEASLAADAQGKFWELHDIMMAHQDDLSRDAIIGYAQQAGLDTARLAAALDQHTYAQAIAADIDGGTQIGVVGTPSFVINGHELRGALPIDEFRTAINAALAANN